jgi:hypothetical protein
MPVARYRSSMIEGFFPTVETLSKQIFGEPGLYQVNMQTSPAETLLFDEDKSFTGDEYNFKKLYNYRTASISHAVYDFIKQM